MSESSQKSLADKDLAVKATGLSKIYKLNKQPESGVAGFLGRQQTEEFAALCDVDLEIPRGEVFGIIGRNGAGKTTLLRIISGVLKQSAGEIKVNGRVAAILELGTGFHPERTGRENIIVGGMYMGFERAELEAKMDQIIDFAEIGQFIDQPLKTFSMGMKSRLAFAIGTAVDSEILIVDEVLSVGDAKFERKCFAHFDRLRAAGKTILFVTHYNQLIEMICDSAVYLKEGRVARVGNPREVNAQYMADLFGPEEGGLVLEEKLEVDGAVSQRFGNGGAEIVEFGLFTADGKPVNRVKPGGTYQIRSKVRCNIDRIERINLGINILSKHGVRLFAINPIMAGEEHVAVSRGEFLEAVCDVTINLGGGDYFITFGAWSHESDTHYDRLEDAIHFVVDDQGRGDLQNSLVNLQPVYRLHKPQAVE